MPNVFSRIPTRFHRLASKALLVATALCAFTTLMVFGIYSETTETSGHLWWKKTREIPFDERRPYLIAGIVLVLIALTCLLGTVELWAVQARRREHAPGVAGRSRLGLPFLVVRAMRLRRQEAQRRRYERTPIGRAEAAYERGDEYFSAEFEADQWLAQNSTPSAQRVGAHEILAAGTKSRPTRAPCMTALTR